ncbi:MAG: calcium-binding protein [Pseudomonadota bacterium]
MSTRVSYSGRGSVEEALAVFAAELTELGITLEDVQPVPPPPCGAAPVDITIHDAGWSLVPYTGELPETDAVLEGVAGLSVFLASGLAGPDAAEALAILDDRAATLVATTDYFTADYETAPDRLKFKGGIALLLDEDDPRVLAGAGNDVIWGSNRQDTIAGGWGDDVIVGDRQQDTLYSNAGNDMLLGGQGRDWLHANGGKNIVDGGAGNDILVLDGRIEAYDIDVFRFSTDLNGNGILSGSESLEIARVAQLGTNNLTWTVDVEFFEFKGVTREREVDAFGVASWRIEDAEDIEVRFDDLYDAATDAADLPNDLLALAGLDISAAAFEV